MYIFITWTSFNHSMDIYVITFASQGVSLEESVSILFLQPGKNCTRTILPVPSRSRWRSSSHYNDVIMSTMASQISSLAIVYLTVNSRCISKKISKLRVTGLCEGNLPVTCEFPAQRASNAENVSIWWRHRDGTDDCELSFLWYQNDPE